MNFNFDENPWICWKRYANCLWLLMQYALSIRIEVTSIRFDCYHAPIAVASLYRDTCCYDICFTCSCPLYRDICVTSSCLLFSATTLLLVFSFLQHLSHSYSPPLILSLSTSSFLDDNHPPGCCICVAGSFEAPPVTASSATGLSPPMVSFSSDFSCIVKHWALPVIAGLAPDREPSRPLAL